MRDEIYKEISLRLNRRSKKIVERIVMNMTVATWYGFSVEIFYMFKKDKPIEVTRDSVYSLLMSKLLDTLYLSIPYRHIALHKMSEHPYLWGYEIFMENSRCKSFKPIECFLSPMRLKTGIGYIYINDIRDGCKYVSEILKKPLECKKLINSIEEATSYV